MSKEMRECRAKREIKSVPAGSRVAALRLRDSTKIPARPWFGKCRGIRWRIPLTDRRHGYGGRRIGKTTGAPAGRRTRQQCLR